jgi:hypothetical protein
LGIFPEPDCTRKFDANLLTPETHQWYRAGRFKNLARHKIKVPPVVALVLQNEMVRCLIQLYPCLDFDLPRYPLLAGEEKIANAASAGQATAQAIILYAFNFI